MWKTVTMAAGRSVMPTRMTRVSVSVLVSFTPTLHQKQSDNVWFPWVNLEHTNSHGNKIYYIEYDEISLKQTEMNR